MNTDSLEVFIPGILVGLVLLFTLVFVLNKVLFVFLEPWDKQRIAKSLGKQNCVLVTAKAVSFLERGSDEATTRTYRITYRDLDGKAHSNVCRTNVNGVYVRLDS
jgi:hypothetical protein